MYWGVLDTKDNLWIGDDSGPKVFEDYAIARIAAQVFEDQVLNTDLACRFQARELPFNFTWRKRDELPVNRSGLASLRRIEGDSDGSQ